MDSGCNNIPPDQGCRTLQEAVIDEYSVKVEWRPTEQKQNGWRKIYSIATWSTTSLLWGQEGLNVGHLSGKPS